MIRSGYTLPAACAGVLIAGLLGEAPLRADSIAAQRENAAARFMSSTGVALPNVELPASVQAPDGKLTLHADFAAADDKGVPIYLVNRTSQPLAIDTQDDNLYLKLFYKEADGGWKRAQSHLSSDCGNSYYGTVLRPGFHFRTKGYRATGGKSATVRYQILDTNLVSNEGPGFWLTQDVEVAARDGRGIAAVPCLSRIVIPPKEAEQVSPEVMESSLAALVLAREWGDEATYQTVAGRLREDIERRAKPDPAGAKPLLERLEKISGGDAPAGASPDRFHRQCMDLIAGKSGSSPVDRERLRDMAWSGLDWLNKKQQMTPARWEEIFALIRKNHQTADLMEQARMAGMIRNNPAVHEYLSTDELVAGATSGKPAFREACMERLGDRGAWPDLIRIGRMQKDSSRFQVMRYFCADNGNGSQYGAGTNRRGLRRVTHPDQMAFWKECLADDILESAVAMHGAIEGTLNPSMEGWLRQAVSENLLQLVKEADSKPWPEKATGNAYGTRCVLTLLGDMRSKPDPALVRVAALGEIRPDGESDQQNAARKEAAKQAALLVRKSMVE